ncbi:MAG: ATP-dependent metallopeptidase FtsH/Yme1/Tma family protein [Candidatus Latescibacteria bacterium]|nr:ATP-dependent metallopeptidase FtsH/Yme1/Tma family protein [Candidatus Latescibacterota bacterium]
MLSMVFVQFFSRTRSEEMVISYTNFRQQLQNRNIRSVTISEKTLVGEFVTGVPSRSGVSQETIETKFKVLIPFEDPALIRELEENGVEITARTKTTPWLTYALTWFPYIFFIAFWLFLFRQMQGGQKGVFSFGKSRAKLVTGDRPKVTFSDVAGVPEAKQDLQEIIEFLKDPEKFRRFGARLPKGALLLGPPGTGKTLLARAVAGEAGVPFFSMSGSDFVEMFVGVGASRVRDLFEQGKRNAPCILFIDEMDAVGRHRGAGLGGGHDEREQTLNQLLVEMDGFDANDGVILIAATNRPDVLDPALLRPGRFDRHIVVDRPDVKGREDILRIKTQNKPLAEDVKLDILARSTPGMSGADLENMVNEAALLAARLNHPMITMAAFEQAKDKIIMGAERKLVITDQEKRIIAYHEAGHALLHELIPEINALHKVTVVSRGRALGVTYALPSDDQYLYSRKQCLGDITSLLGGQVAEQLVFDELTTGASNDIERATELARKMVCDWGMSRLGPLALGKKDEEIFLGREIVQHRDYSDQTAVQIDQEIKHIIDQCGSRAEQLLRENLDTLHRLAAALLEHETLERDQLDKLFRGEPINGTLPEQDDQGPLPSDPPREAVQAAAVIQSHASADPTAEKQD